MNKELSLKDKVGMIHLQIETLRKSISIYEKDKAFPQLNTDYRPKDEDTFTDETLSKFHRELESYLLDLRKFEEDQKQGFENFKIALAKNDEEHSLVKLINDSVPKRTWHGFGANDGKPRALNKLYHPEINYDTDPIPQVYALVASGRWNEAA